MDWIVSALQVFEWSATMLKSAASTLVGSWYFPVGIAAVCASFDVHYPFRAGHAALSGVIKRWRRPENPKTSRDMLNTFLAPSILPSICWLTDMDLLFHMNNSRYLRECDFGRYKFFSSVVNMPVVMGQGFNMVVGSSSIRFRRSLNLLDRFVVDTRIVGWDVRNFYIRHLIRRSKDDFVCAVALIRVSIIGGDVAGFINSALQAEGIEEADLDVLSQSPTLPEEFQLWIQSDRVSSAILNPKKE